MKELRTNYDTEINFGNFESNTLFIEKVGILNKKKQILEIGCGLGSMTNYLAKKHYNIQGIEINTKYINQSRKLFNNLPIQNMSGNSLAFKKESFDIVLSFDVFEHIPDSDRHLKEVSRILKKSGYYLLQTPNKWTNVPYEIIRGKSLTKYKQEHCSLHNYWQLKKRFIKNGFDITFINIPVVNNFFKERLKKALGKLGLWIIRIVNPDKLPYFLRTNFYIVAQKCE